MNYDSGPHGHNIKNDIASVKILLHQSSNVSFQKPLLAMKARIG